jgi:hypothetical protein
MLRETDGSGWIDAARTRRADPPADVARPQYTSRHTRVVAGGGLGLGSNFQGHRLLLGASNMVLWADCSEETDRMGATGSCSPAIALAEKLIEADRPHAEMIFSRLEKHAAPRSPDIYLFYALASVRFKLISITWFERPDTGIRRPPWRCPRISTNPRSG